MHKNMERLIRGSGLTSTFVRPGMFAANALGWWAARIREHDVIRWPYGDAATAPIDERDIAAVAVRALLDDATSGAEYMITGPHSLTQREQVIAIGDVIDRTLRFEEIAPDDARRDLGFPRAAIDMLLDAWSAAVGLPAYVTTTVAEVTGTPARTFAEWVRSNKEAFCSPVRVRRSIIELGPRRRTSFIASTSLTSGRVVASASASEMNVATYSTIPRALRGAN